MYEACGRIINPVHGSVGLMCSGDWPRCQAAVEAVLLGKPLAASDEVQSCDIRHLSKGARRGPIRSRSKRDAESPAETKFTITGWDELDRKGFEVKRARSHDSYSVETVEPALVNRGGVKPEPEETWLELTLGAPNLVIEISDAEN